MEKTRKSIQKEQARYKRNFDARLRKLRHEISKGAFLFLRKEQGTAEEPKYKLVRVAAGTYQVLEVADDTVIISKGDEHETVSRDRMELAPSPLDYSQDSSLKCAFESLQGEGNKSQMGDGHRKVQDNRQPYYTIRSRNGQKEVPSGRFTSRGLAEFHMEPQNGETLLVLRGRASGSPIWEEIFVPDVVAKTWTKKKATKTSSKELPIRVGPLVVDAARGCGSKKTTPRRAAHWAKSKRLIPNKSPNSLLRSRRPLIEGVRKVIAEYVTVDHKVERGKLMLHVKWYAYPSSDNIWEHVKGLPRSIVPR